MFSSGIDFIFAFEDKLSAAETHDRPSLRDHPVRPESSPFSAHYSEYTGFVLVPFQVLFARYTGEVDSTHYSPLPASQVEARDLMSVSCRRGGRKPYSLLDGQMDKMDGQRTDPRSTGRERGRDADSKRAQPRVYTAVGGESSSTRARSSKYCSYLPSHRDIELTMVFVSVNEAGGGVFGSGG